MTEELHLPSETWDHERLADLEVVTKVERMLDQSKVDVGAQLTPAMREFVDDLARAHLRQPTRTERLALWLMRCPAVPWRVTRSRGGKVTATRHGPLTGAVVAIGRWLWRRG